MNQKTKPQDNPNAEVRRGNKVTPVSQRGKPARKTCLARLGRQFVQLYIIAAGMCGITYVASELPGDISIHTAWTVGVVSLASTFIVWWLEARKRE